MVNQVNKAAIAVYAAFISGCCAAKNALRDLREDQRGVSGIVVSVLLILVGVMAVVVLYNVVRPLIQTTVTDQAGGAIAGLTPDAVGR